LLDSNGYNTKREGGGMKLGCSKEYPVCDGLFRSETKRAVEEFQSSIPGLKVDGVVGYKTWQAMCSNLKFTISLPKKNFCKECNCKEEQRWDDDRWQERDDDRWQERDEYDPIKIIDTIDCKLIKDCVVKHIMVPAPNYKEFERCIGWGNGNKKTDKYNCEECRKQFKPGYINLMPMIDPTEEQMRIHNLGRWCVEHCDGIYKAAV
jgi:hypothetical protein